jgi:large subunit ribosomal protein L2
MIKNLESLQDLNYKFKSKFKLKQKFFLNSKKCHKKNPLSVSYNFYRGVVEKFEHNPKKNTFLLKIFDFDKRQHFYTTSVSNLVIGSFVISNYQVKIKLGNRCSLKNIPTGTVVNSVEFGLTKLIFDKRLISRSAGSFCQLLQKTNDYCLLKLPSNRFKRVCVHNFATIGLVSNLGFKSVCLNKAGRSRWLSNRPRVRGVAKNPVDHPHGGGEGKSSGGRHPVSPWGKRLKK